MNGVSFRTILRINALLLFLFLFECVFVAGQEPTCKLAVKVTDVSGRKKISDVFVEAYDSDSHKTFYALPNNSTYFFEGLRSSYYHLSVQKRGFRVSRYLYNLNCDALNSTKAVVINVPMHVGNIGEQVNVTPQERYSSDDRPQFGLPLTKDDIGRLFNVVNGIARELGKAGYPAAAKAVKAAGPVSVHVIVKEDGTVESAEAVSGHPLLQPAALEAAKKSRFNRTLIGNKPIKIAGFIIYNFVIK